jgi:hypothetical protein
LEQASAVGVTYSALQAYLADDQWRFPVHCKMKAKQLHRIFSDWRNPGEDKKVRGSASELLGLYGLLRHFFETRITLFRWVRVEIHRGKRFEFLL